ncbi:MAG: flagellar basal body P-ring formation protein FlgA [Candidatus Eremiobacteraeota bacterium]|nr:flagellar basal body P-ring formation protein FlgA [Candidatus Eremiobacteraeota bacterium]MBV8354495.1 flagellar basal body P-ring formation protein FlgA [Candidatus Eremiobacteraeota bacterium]
MRRSLAFIVSLLALLWPAMVPAAAVASAAGTQVVPASRLVAIADQVARGLVNEPDREVRAAFALTDQRVPVGDLAIEAEPLHTSPAYVSIPLDITVDGRIVRTVYAGYRVVAFVHTAVAAHDLIAGTLLAAGDFTLQRLPSVGRPAVEIQTLVGRKINISVPRGTPVYVEQTRVNELVKAGQPVVFILHDGSVALTADVVARTSGGLGETVAVFNPATRKGLSGIVTGPAKVEFTLPDAEAGS